MREGVRGGGYERGRGVRYERVVRGEDMREGVRGG